MPDTLTSQQRHRIMAAIHSSGTKPELTVRKYLFSHGYRYRLNHPRLPGSPDVVLRKYRTVIFVNGCFWHGHEACGNYRLPKTHTPFWRDKVEKNRARDLRVQRQLAAMGWHVITIWECQLSKKNAEATLRGLETTLYHIYIADRAPRRYALPEDNGGLGMAAEPSLS